MTHFDPSCCNTCPEPKLEVLRLVSVNPSIVVAPEDASCQVPSDLKNLVVSPDVDAGTKPDAVPPKAPGLYFM